MRHVAMPHTCSAAEVFDTHTGSVPKPLNTGAQVAFIRAYRHPKQVVKLRKAGFHEAGRYISSNGVGTVLVMLRINRHVA